METRLLYVLLFISTPLRRKTSRLCLVFYNSNKGGRSIPKHGLDIFDHGINREISYSWKVSQQDGRLWLACFLPSNFVVMPFKTMKTLFFSPKVLFLHNFLKKFKYWNFLTFLQKKFLNKVEGTSLRNYIFWYPFNNNVNVVNDFERIQFFRRKPIYFSRKDPNYVSFEKFNYFCRIQRKFAIIWWLKNFQIQPDANVKPGKPIHKSVDKRSFSAFWEDDFSSRL